MRYFITGATGFIGGEIVRQLQQQGHEVVALVRKPAAARCLQEMGVILKSGDVTDKVSVLAGMEGADGVFHCAGWYQMGARDKRAAEQINVLGTRNVLEAMRELKIKKGVHTSTLSVFSDTRGQLVDERYRYQGAHLSEYDRTKWMAHYQVAEPMIKEGLPLVIVQPGMTYGPGDSLHSTWVKYLTGKLPMAPQQTAFCWAHVEDTARGHIQAMEHGKAGESYIIAGPKHTLVEVFETAEQITGIPAPKFRAKPGMLKGMAGMMGLVEKVVPVPADYAAESLRVMAGVTYIGSSAKAARELGFRTRPLAEGLKETLEYELRLLGKKA